jgi:hypothetical protein
MNPISKILRRRKMENTESIIQMLPYLAPIIVLNLVLLVICLVDISKRQHVTGGKKIVWILVSVLFQTVGPIAYLVFGRKEPQVESDQY